MKLSRLLAAAFTATGLFLAFPPGKASANDITTAAVTCSGWSVAFAHFPEDANVTLDVAVTYPNGTTSQSHAYTYGETEGTRTGGTTWEGTGLVDITVAWELEDGPHSFAISSAIDCPPSEIPDTPPATQPAPPELAPPITSEIPDTPPAELPGTPELAFTGAGSTLLGAVGGLMLALGILALIRSRRP